MRALVFRDKQLRLERDYPNPEPAPDEALIRVVQAGICNTDLEIIQGYMDFQGVLGHEFVGVVEHVYHQKGASVDSSLEGHRVVGDINAACRRSDCRYCSQGMHTHCPNRTTLGIVNRDGAFAEYLRLPVENLHLVPDSISDEEAVFVEPLAANFQILEQVHIPPTASVVVLGDGKMGQLAVRVLALTGCELIMVGKHEEKLALAAPHVSETFVLKDPETFHLRGKGRVDVVVECTGSAQGLTLAARLCRPRGTVVLKSTVADPSQLQLAPFVVDEIRVQGSRCGPFLPALRVLQRGLIDVRPLISARCILDEGLEAFEKAAQPGVLKVLMKI